MAKLAIRSREEEQMDSPDLDSAVYEKVLHDLARINRFTFTAHPVLAFLRRAVGSAKRFRLMDVGFGDGDILRSVARWAAKNGIEADLVGVDLNEKSVAAARAATPADMRIDYRAGRQVIVPPGYSILEASRAAHLPHVAVCGGRGRCSTCRVAVWRGLEGAPPAEEAELETSISQPAITSDVT